MFSAVFSDSVDFLCMDSTLEMNAVRPDKHMTEHPAEF